MTATFLTAALWTLFVAYWLSASRHAKRTATAGQSRAIRIVALVFMAAGPALYYLPLDSVPVLGRRVMPQGPVCDASGLCLMLAGISLAVWSRVTLADNWSGAVTLKRNHALITTGPYGIVRHPIYLGVLTAMLGTAIVIGEARAFLPLLGVFGIWKKMDAEEALMRSAFPTAYAAYEQHVRRRLIPGVW
jgi:protein-S-isoprenylcysteine O-methyltransferase Ste14